jgi:hypothetical protein
MHALFSTAASALPMHVRSPHASPAPSTVHKRESKTFFSKSLKKLANYHNPKNLQLKQKKAASKK